MSEERARSTDAGADSSEGIGGGIRVSVCVATFNAGDYLAPQLASILSQLGDSDEVVASDNGSTDGTRERLAALADGDPRVRVLDLAASRPTGKENLIANFENALAAARGRYVLLSDQDDVWLPHRVARTLAALREYDLVAGDAQVIDGDGRVVLASYLRAHGLRRGWWRAMLRNPYLGCTVGLRREVLAKALPFPAKLPMHDIYLGMVAETYFRPALLDVPLIQYRRHGANASSAGERSPFTLAEKFGFRVRTLLALARVLPR